jgi:nucleoside-diphosphate-sugar epimerase
LSIKIVSKLLRIKFIMGTNYPPNGWLENSHPRKVFVVGGAGYVGLEVTNALLAAGFEVTVFDALIHGTEPLDYLVNKPNLSFVRGDVRDIGQVNSAIKGHWAVIVLASLVGEPACDKNPDETLAINYLATLNLLECAKKQDVSRFIFTSTDSCYGTREREKLDELSPLAPISLYAELKAEIEEKIMSGPKIPGFSPTILRLATVYGMSPRPRFDLVVNLLVREITLRGAARIFSGEQWRPLVHVRDAAQAFRLTLQAPDDLVNGEIFNVGADEQNIRFEALRELLLKVNPEGLIEIVPALPDLRDYFVKFGKIKNALGFKPSISILEGMEEIRDHLRAGIPADPYSIKWRNS